VPDTYGVLHADISGELPGLFPGGFTVNTKPTAVQVTAWIAAADTIITLKVQDITGAVPAVADKAAVLAKRYVIEWVKAQVMRAAYVGNDPLEVKAAADPYDIVAKQYMDALVELGAQAAGTGEAASRVTVPYTTPQRELMIRDEQLEDDEGFRERRF
jgi:hypothetical protein